MRIVLTLLLFGLIPNPDTRSGSLLVSFFALDGQML
jgi:hypothetical protein